MEVTIVWDGVSSQSLGVTVEGLIIPTSTPERVFNSVKVAGRNGDVITDNAIAFENTTQKYTMHWLATQHSLVMDWLFHTPTKYIRLEDSLHPNMFRMAYIEKSSTVSNINNVLYRAEIVFSCKPQFFLTSGETKTTYSTGSQSSIQLYNPGMPTFPLVDVVLKETLPSQGARIGFTEVLSGQTNTVRISHDCPVRNVTIDFETLSAWNTNAPDENLGQYISIPVGQHQPRIELYNNAMVFSGLDSIKLLPRWWVIM